MKRKYTLFLIAALLTVISWSAQAQMVTRDEALTVARNWITQIINHKGDWGGAANAYVEEIIKWDNGKHTLGWFCDIYPIGFIVVPIRKELGAIKAYSTSSDIDPFSKHGMSDLLQVKIGGILDVIESKFGPIEKVATTDLESIMEFSYQTFWDEVYQGVDRNYQEGDTLVTAHWTQGHPYDQDCPGPPEGDDCEEEHCRVGCVATAAAMLMKYWNWPPYGTMLPLYMDAYDWANMPNVLSEHSPPVAVNAVAELCHEVGVAVGMEYCEGDACASRADTYDMEGAYEDIFYYSDVTIEYHLGYSPSEWFDLIKYELDRNRPIQYRVEGHSIVCDGWREDVTGLVKEYHMNYGHDSNDTMWYLLDNLHLGNPFIEYMLVNIKPSVSLGTDLIGNYPKNDALPFRYFDRHATGWSTTFQPGQNLQFLPGLVLKGAQDVRILSSYSQMTRMYSHPSRVKGIRLKGGSIALNRYGCIRMY
jgi:hypothetical protein